MPTRLILATVTAGVVAELSVQSRFFYKESMEGSWVSPIPRNDAAALVQLLVGHGESARGLPRLC